MQARPPTLSPISFIPVLAAAALFAAACSEDPAGTANTSSSTNTGGTGGGGGGAGGGAGGDGPDLPWNAHKIPPKDTDPAIDDFLADHYAGFDEKAAPNGKLFVHLPGVSGAPEGSLLLLTEAARAGYHVIGLMYANGSSVADLCAADLDCYELVRLEIIDGMDRTDKIAVSPANSIQNRLTKLLDHLNTKYPAEGWGAFLQNGEPLYASIALSGYSQGGGHAALIAKTRELARVVLFSAVTDGQGGMPAAWLKKSSATINGLHYGIAHTADPIKDQILTNWGTLGLSFFGVPVDVDTIQPPYANSHQLTTSLPPASGSGHGATVLDAETPLTEQGQPVLAPAWTYLIGK